jgi:hypothetical protein
MNSQEYINLKLDDLKKPTNTPVPENDQLLAGAIFKIVMSKKFRKYSVTPELERHIRNAINLNIHNREPINVTFLHGAYKLWRLEESPEADWAELFAAMYYTNWLKTICEIYTPGVWFDFYVDDLIIPVLNNLEVSKVKEYINSFQKVLDFLKQYQLPNFKMTITGVGSQFGSPENFLALLNKNIETAKADIQKAEPLFTERQLEMVEFNAIPTSEQLKDPLWREKIHFAHDVYIKMKTEQGYHKKPEKILAFTQPLRSGTVMAVGTTKTSVAKFWVGVGVLKNKDQGFIEYIYSPSQLAESKFKWDAVSIVGLEGKNFSKIRIIE